MTQEEKELLLKDLCARLPYGVICEDMEGKTRPLFGITPTQHFIVTLDNATDGTNGLKFCTIDCAKPYIRPMSSMTEEEKHYIDNRWGADNYGDIITYSSYEGGMSTVELADIIGFQDWLNAHHFDYRGLIPKGLAIAVTNGNSPYKE